MSTDAEDRCNIANILFVSSKEEVGYYRKIHMSMRFLEGMKLDDGVDLSFRLNENLLTHVHLSHGGLLRTHVI